MAATGVQWPVSLQNTPESNPGQSSSIASIATHLFAEGSRKKKQEDVEEALEETVPDVYALLKYQNKPKSSQPESHINVTSQSH